LDRLYYLVESVRVFSRIKNIPEGVNYVKNDMVFSGFTFISAMTNMNEVITDRDSKGNYLTVMLLNSVKSFLVVHWIA